MDIWREKYPNKPTLKLPVPVTVTPRKKNKQGGGGGRKYMPAEKEPVNRGVLSGGLSDVTDSLINFEQEFQDLNNVPELAKKGLEYIEKKHIRCFCCNWTWYL